MLTGDQLPTADSSDATAGNADDNEPSTTPAPQTRSRSQSSKTSSGSRRKRSRSTEKNAQGQKIAGKRAPLALGFVPWLKSQKYVDAMLRLQTTEGKVSTFPAHRIVLSRRSPFFDHLFSEVRAPSLQVQSYDLPLLPDHPLLHEALGFILWYLYTDEPLETSSMAIPERQWDLIVGVYTISEMLGLEELRDYYSGVLKSAIESCRTDSTGGQSDVNGNMSEVHAIAVQSLKWGSQDIAELATNCIMALSGAVLTDPKLLSVLKPETLEGVLESMEPSSRLQLIRSFFDAKRSSGINVPPESIASIWGYVSFENASIQDMEELHLFLGKPHAPVLDVSASILMVDPSALSRASLQFFLEVADRAVLVAKEFEELQRSPTLVADGDREQTVPVAPRPSTSSTLRDGRNGWTPTDTYTLVRGYIAVHRNKPWLTDEARQQLWSRVSFAELPHSVLQRAEREGIAPKTVLADAMFQKLRGSFVSVFTVEERSPSIGPSRNEVLRSPPLPEYSVVPQLDQSPTLVPSAVGSPEFGTPLRVRRQESQGSPASSTTNLSTASSRQTTLLDGKSPPNVLSPKLRPIFNSPRRSVPPAVSFNDSSSPRSPGYVTSPSSVSVPGYFQLPDAMMEARPFEGTPAIPAIPSRLTSPVSLDRPGSGSYVSRSDSDSSLHRKNYSLPTSHTSHGSISQIGVLSRQPSVAAAPHSVQSMVAETSGDEISTISRGSDVSSGGTTRIPFRFPNGYTTSFELVFSDPYSEGIVGPLKDSQWHAQCTWDYRPTFDGKLLQAIYTPRSPEKVKKDYPGTCAVQFIFIMATREIFDLAQKKFPGKGVLFGARNLVPFTSSLKNMTVEIAPITGPINRAKGVQSQIYVVKDVGQAFSQESRERFFKNMVEIVHRGDWGDTHIPRVHSGTSSDEWKTPREHALGVSKAILFNSLSS
ncbi:hypothetical protein M427DRAFT_54642 [Gonapodya prolifera JEL478]|uniref:BTB domain-containing protein n=1 Tax=Gonapodya prolifera (strain JEL478) TaxID=1344416 RepID=A0A139ALH6_GONPJ|nr:hypothetical protein M427DRAFT_54642 [Gonapodya prolifera JEL478]|eukprot:KXS17353.1 hypothetical protein M427DRAFT_54642 [Gonapodya prolifera JEL478]